MLGGMLQSPSLPLPGMPCRAWDVCCHVTFQVAPCSISITQHFSCQTSSSRSQRTQRMLLLVREHAHRTRSTAALPAPSSQGWRDEGPLPLSQHTRDISVFYCKTTEAQMHVGRSLLFPSWASPREGDNMLYF